VPILLTASRIAAAAFFASLALSVAGCDASDPGKSGAAQPASKQPSVSAKAVPASQAPPAAVLTRDDLIGKPPPPLVVGKWVKGTPLAEFEKGKVYVVDFWATWCGPCIAAIPHLTQLQQKHAGKLEVVGISISEKQKDASDTAYIDLVDQFVQKKGDRMEYRVGVDTPDKTMHTTWFKPSGTGGIPTAWIIDQKGLVAWIGIGSPKTVERIVEEVLAGTFDIKKEEELQRQAEAEAKQRSEADIAAAKARTQDASNEQDRKYPGYREAMERGDQLAALASLDAAFKADPSTESSGAYQWKLMILLQRSDVDGVNQYSRDLVTRFGTDDDVVSFVSAVIVSTGEEVKFDKQIALEAAQKAAAVAKPGSRWAQFTKWRLGWALFHTGETQKAIESMQSALEGVKALKGQFDFNDLDIQCEDALKHFAKK
jgi:thiol-disulfide isomerase/thioredoxin